MANKTLRLNLIEKYFSTPLLNFFLVERTKKSQQNFPAILTVEKNLSKKQPFLKLTIMLQTAKLARIMKCTFLHYDSFLKQTLLFIVKYVSSVKQKSNSNLGEKT